MNVADLPEPHAAPVTASETIVTIPVRKEAAQETATESPVRKGHAGNVLPGKALPEKVFPRNALPGKAFPKNALPRTAPPKAALPREGGVLW